MISYIASSTSLLSFVIICINMIIVLCYVDFYKPKYVILWIIKYKYLFLNCILNNLCILKIHHSMYTILYPHTVYYTLCITGLFRFFGNNFRTFIKWLIRVVVCCASTYKYVVLGEIPCTLCMPAPNRPAALFSSPPQPLPLLNLSGEASGHLWIHRWPEKKFKIIAIANW